MSGTSRRRQAPLPKPSIQSVLVILGADEHDIPTGYGWLRMRCFGHEDRTPSARVNHELDAYKCFSCLRSGDALKLLQTELGLSFTEALKRASDLSPDSGKRQSRRSSTRRPSDLLKGGN